MNASRWSAGRRSRTRGCWTSTAPMPVWMVRSGRWPLRTTWRRPGVVLEVGVVVDPGGDLGLDGLGQQAPGPVPEEVGEDVLAGGPGARCGSRW